MVSVAGMECIDMYNIKKIVQRELCVIAQAGGVLIRLASSVLNLPEWQVEVLWKYNYRSTLRHII